MKHHHLDQFSIRGPWWISDDIICPLNTSGYRRSCRCFLFCFWPKRWSLIYGSIIWDHWIDIYQNQWIITPRGLPEYRFKDTECFLQLCLLIKTVKLILLASKLNKPGILSKMHQHLLNSLINTSYLGCLIRLKAGVKMTRWGLSGRLFL